MIDYTFLSVLGIFLKLQQQAKINLHWEED